MASRQEEAFYQSCRACARTQGRQVGLAGDWLEDCAQAFVVKLLLKPADPPIWQWTPARRDMFVRTAARNHVLNFLRDNDRHFRPGREDANDVYYESCESRQDQSALPVPHLMRGLFWQEIQEALVGLTPLQRTLLVRFYICNDTVAELAVALQCRHHAVHGSLTYARKRLRACLTERGSTELELRSYLQSGHGSMAGPQLRADEETDLL